MNNKESSLLIKKFIQFIILLIMFFSIEKISFINADYIENILNLKTWVEEIQLDLHELNNPHLNNLKLQKQYKSLKKATYIIKKSIIIQYKNNEFWYYQTKGIIRNYNYFIYYSNKYFSNLKNKEIYWNTVETRFFIQTSLQNLISYYNKFKNLSIKRNMN